MLSRPRTAGLIDNGIARMFVVVLLALVLLAGLIPSGALSATQACKMACCAGKPPHEAGSCNAFLTNAEQEEETPQEATGDEHSSHHGEMQMEDAAVETTEDATVETTVASEHCATAKKSSAQHRATPKASTRPASVAAQAFTTPCSEECAAAALTLASVRRPRDAAAFSIAARPRPPTLYSHSSFINHLSFSSAERRRQSRPRAPPLSLVNP